MPNEEAVPDRMIRPDPDPTIATIALIKAAIDALRESVTARFDSVTDRFAGMDRAQSLFHEDLTRVPTSLDKALGEVREYFEARLERLVAVDEHSKNERLMLLAHLNDAITATKVLHESQLHALMETVSVFKQTVNERFQLGDVQTDKAARDVKSAVDAAFAASKEAVSEQNKSNALAIAKSEGAFTKNMDQLADSVKSIVKNTDDKIGDLKDRLVAIEGRTSVSDPSTAAALRDMAASIERLSTVSTQGAGHAKGTDDSWKNFAIIAAIVISLAAIIVPMLNRIPPH
jgi:hypothetical protein